MIFAILLFISFAFVVSSQKIIQTGNILDCGLGHNSIGTSKKVVEFAKNYDWSHLHRVPDTTYQRLKKQICTFWSDYADLQIENIKVANGSSVFLSRFNKLVIEKEKIVLGYMPQFMEYLNEVKVLEGSYESVFQSPQTGFTFNPDEFIRHMRGYHSVVYIDNPNNPTGQIIGLEAIETILKEAKKKETIVIVDEAYGDYFKRSYSAINLVERYKNLVVTRTFSKGFGVGQFRIGYGVLSTELGEAYDKIDLPFSVSELGADLAREALLDYDFIKKVREQIIKQKKKLIQEFRRRGYLIGQTHPSSPIFIIGHKDPQVDLKTEFLSQRILTASGSGWLNLGKNYVRINTPPNADQLISLLE